MSGWVGGYDGWAPMETSGFQIASFEAAAEVHCMALPCIDMGHLEARLAAAREREWGGDTRAGSVWGMGAVPHVVLETQGGGGVPALELRHFSRERWEKLPRRRRFAFLGARYVTGPQCGVDT